MPLLKTDSEGVPYLVQHVSLSKGERKPFARFLNGKRAYLKLGGEWNWDRNCPDYLIDAYMNELFYKANAYAEYNWEHINYIASSGGMIKTL